MDLMDKELKDQLARDPFKRHGFDDRLRRQIEERLDEPVRKRRGVFRLGWRSSGIALAAMLLVLAAVWAWKGPDIRPLAGDGEESLLVTASGEQTEPAPLEAGEAVASALLVGLRNDAEESGGNNSSYRTVLIAPDRGKLAVVAEGGGILMPYKQDFWKIEPVKTRSGGSLRLIAYNAENGSAPKSAQSLSAERSSVNEKLLYVGNQYVSLAQLRGSEDGSAVREYRFVKTVEQLAADSLRPESDPAAESHVAFEELFAGRKVGKGADALRQAQTEQWSIVRQPGQWVGVKFAGSTSLKPVDAASAEPVGTELPETVVKSDRLAVSWEDILRLEPAAEDAFTSPNGDLLAVVLQNAIDIYPYKQKDAAQQKLTLELAPAESVIMVQWAASESYVESWKERVSAILEGS
jgi:hypothetical protein